MVKKTYNLTNTKNTYKNQQNYTKNYKVIKFYFLINQYYKIAKNKIIKCKEKTMNTKSFYLANKASSYQINPKFLKTYSCLQKPKTVI